MVAIEHFARHRGARSLAAARQQRLAELEQLGGFLPGVRRAAPPQQRAAAFGNRGQQVGEEGVGHGRGRTRKVMPNLIWHLRRRRSHSSAWIVRKYDMPRRRYYSRLVGKFRRRLAGDLPEGVG